MEAFTGASGLKVPTGATLPLTQYQRREVAGSIDSFIYFGKVSAYWYWETLPKLAVRADGGLV